MNNLFTPRAPCDSPYTPHTHDARSLATPPGPEPVPAAAHDIYTSHKPCQGPGASTLARDVDFHTAASAPAGLSEHEKTQVVRNGVPRRDVGATACSIMPTATGRDSCPRLWAVAVVRRDHMGALALGRQQIMGRNRHNHLPRA